MNEPPRSRSPYRASAWPYRRSTQPGPSPAGGSSTAPTSRGSSAETRDLDRPTPDRRKQTDEPRQGVLSGVTIVLAIGTLLVATRVGDAGQAEKRQSPPAPPPQHADEKSTKKPGEPNLSVRRLLVGSVSLPFYAPAWLGGDGWPRFREVARAEDEVGLRAMLVRLASEIEGRAIAPPESERSGSTEWIRVAPPAEALRRWWQQIAPKDLVLPSSLLQAGITDSPTDPPLLSTSPPLWLSPPGEPMLRWKQIAWEGGRLEELWLVDRSVRSSFPEAASASDSVSSPEAVSSPDSASSGEGATQPSNVHALAQDSRIRRWLHRSRGHLRIKPKESEYRSSFPTGQFASDPELPESGKLYLESSYPIELAPSPSLAADGARPRRRGTPTTRRSTLGSIYPILGPDQAILGTGSEAFAIKLSAPSSVLWSIRSSDLGFPRSWPALLLHAVAPIPWRDTLWTLFRTAREETKNGSISYITLGGEYQRGLSYHRMVGLRSPTTPDASPRRVAPGGSILSREPKPRLDLKIDRAVPADATICGPPLVRGDVIFVPYFRGFREIEVSLLAYDLANSSVRWEQFLTSYSVDWLSAADLRNLLPEVFLEEYAGDLLVTLNHGLVVRLGARRGDQRGAFCYPRHRLEELFVGSRSIIRGYRMQGLPDPRPRAPGPSFILEPKATDPTNTKKQRGPLWVVLPPDGRHVLGIDLDTWELAWTQPVPRRTHLLGHDEHGIVLVDLDIPLGEHELKLRRLDPETGRHLQLKNIRLACRESKRPGGDPDPVGPLLRGIPRAVGSQLWIPTLTGIEVFSLNPAAPEEDDSPLDPTRVWPWPNLSTGGTPIPVGSGRILTVHRGDAGLMSSGFLEIFRVIP